MSAFTLLVSGPSGAGKPTLLKELFDEFQEKLYFSVSSTTRLPGKGGQHGVDCYLITYDEFQQNIDKEQFLEWARIHENFYDISLEHTQSALNDREIAVFGIDVQGLRVVKKKMTEKIIPVFITIKNKDELKERLTRRDTDTILQLEKRLQNASDEIKELNKYDYFIINDKLEESHGTLGAVLIAHKFKTKGQNLE